MKDKIHKLYENYDNYLEKNILYRRFKHKELIPILKKHTDFFEITEIGKSFENREILNLKIGEGKTQILLWSQMHGNEPTATLALLDIFNFFEKKNNFDEFDDIRKSILKNCSLNFIPLLNPDGAEYFIRRNAQAIDLNRDALRNSAPESMILKSAIENIKPEFGFNLHDQELYYGVENTGKPTSMAFLTPSFNFEKTVDTNREKSMKVIAGIANMLQNYIPNQIAKYSDAYMPTAFGDFIQKQGTSTILIESGFYENDIERQYIRKLNFISIIFSLYSIANKTYENEKIADYQKIPMNNRDAFFDYLIKNVTIIKNDKSYIADIGISREKSDKENFTDYITNYVIWDIGDLSQYSGHTIIDYDFNELIDYDNKITKYEDAYWLIRFFM